MIKKIIAIVLCSVVAVTAIVCSTVYGVVTTIDKNIREKGVLYKVPIKIIEVVDGKIFFQIDDDDAKVLYNYKNTDKKYIVIDDDDFDIDDDDFTDEKPLKPYIIINKDNAKRFSEYEYDGVFQYDDLDDAYASVKIYDGKVRVEKIYTEENKLNHFKEDLKNEIEAQKENTENKIEAHKEQIDKLKEDGENIKEQIEGFVDDLKDIF